MYRKLKMINVQIFGASIFKKSTKINSVYTVKEMYYLNIPIDFKFQYSNLYLKYQKTSFFWKISCGN